MATFLLPKNRYSFGVMQHHMEQTARLQVGAARVMEDSGSDVTLQFINGANLALKKVEARGIRVAVLKDGSPSCGSSYTYDGSFSGKTVRQLGVTAERLRRAAVLVFNEEQFEVAQAEIDRLERTSAS